MSEQYKKYKDTNTEELVEFLTEMVNSVKAKKDIIANNTTDKSYAKVLNKMVHRTEKEIEAITTILNERN